MTRTLLAACAVLWMLSQQLDAACMLPPPPCDALAQSEVVFYGEVLEVTSRPYIVGTDIALLSVRFNVLRALKGVKEGPFLKRSITDRKVCCFSRTGVISSTQFEGRDRFC